MQNGQWVHLRRQVLVECVGSFARLQPHPNPPRHRGGNRHITTGVHGSSPAGGGGAMLASDCVRVPSPRVPLGRGEGLGWGKPISLCSCLSSIQCFPLVRCNLAWVAGFVFRPIQDLNHPQRYTKTHKSELLLRETSWPFVDNYFFGVALGKGVFCERSGLRVFRYGFVP